MAASKKSKPLGYLFKIPLYLDFTFWLGLLLFSTSFATEYTGSALDKYLYGFLTFALLFLCVTLHEFGHCFAARSVGVKPLSITLMLFGGLAALDNMGKRPRDVMWIALAGPLVSAALYILFTLVSPGFSGNVGLLLSEIAGINLILLAFNMAPSMPLDGGRALSGLLWAFFTRGKKVVERDYHRAVALIVPWVSYPIILGYIIVKGFVLKDAGIFTYLITFLVFNWASAELQNSKKALRYETIEVYKPMLPVRYLAPGEVIAEIGETLEAVDFYCVTGSHGLSLRSVPQRLIKTDITREVIHLDLEQEEVIGFIDLGKNLWDLVSEDSWGKKGFFVVVSRDKWLGVVSKHLVKNYVDALDAETAKSTGRKKMIAPSKK